MTTLTDRFWAKVSQSEDGCWEWTASIATSGYGQIRAAGKPRYAHRVSWELHNGEIPDGRWVLHTCDNRRCVRPDHLYLGSAKDNAADTHQRGRWHYVPPGQGRPKPVASGRKKGPQITPPAERFWPKVDVRGGDVDQCWEFMGTRFPNGYGSFWMPDYKRKVLAHRIAYALHYGSFDSQLIVMHTCDNPSCCNPHHLRLGTRADNNRDRSSKGRGRENRQWGKDNPRARLTQADVDEMRHLAASGVTQMEIAARFSIKQPQVSRIVRGVSWPMAHGPKGAT
jgi:hypothetical protein